MRQSGVVSWIRHSRTHPTHGVVTTPGEREGGREGGREGDEKEKEGEWGGGKEGLSLSPSLPPPSLPRLPTNERDCGLVVLLSSTDNSTLHSLTLSKVMSQIPQHLTIT